ncbi:MAG: FkbM family methyltransferase, partial [bacterium]
KFSNLITEKNIDYISIDVEGSEMDIIKSIDFNKHNIYCISVENNYGEKNIEDYLNGFGYKLIKVVGADNFFIKNG